MPPDRNAPSGTSELICAETASARSALRLASASASEPVNGLASPPAATGPHVRRDPNISGALFARPVGLRPPHQEALGEHRDRLRTALAHRRSVENSPLMRDRYRVRGLPLQSSSARKQNKMRFFFAYRK